MTLRHFRIFLRVCEAGKMTLAAEELRISQPSVSQAIHELEEYYGVLLFERFGKRLLLSPAGEALKHYVRHLLGTEAQIASAMRKFSDSAPLRIGATISIGESVFIPILQEMHIHFPIQSIHSRIENTRDLEMRILHDELDLALVEGKVQAEHLVEIPFLDDELVLFAAPDLLPGGICSAEEILSEPFFLREEGSGTRLLFEEVMQRAGFSFQVAGVYNQSASIQQAVRAGLGVGVLSRRLVAEELAAGTFVELQIQGLGTQPFARNFRILHHRNKFLGEKLMAFMGICRAYGKRKEAQL